jgi:hypothetical protein
MAIRSLLTKGIGSLMKRMKPKPKPNRRLTPKEIAERELREAEADPVIRMRMAHKYGTRPPDEFMKAMKTLSPGTQMRNATSAQVMRAMKVGDETMDMIRRSVSKMDLPTTKKGLLLTEIQSRLHRLPPAQLAKAKPSELAKDILKIGLGAGAGYGIADNKEAIAEMLKSVKLPTKLDVDLGMTPAGDLFGEPRMMKRRGPFEGGVGNLLRDITPGATLFERNSQISDDTSWPAPNPFDPTDNMRMFGFDYTEPDPEPGLEEGSIADLLLFNRMFGD